MKYGKWVLVALGASLCIGSALAETYDVPPGPDYANDPYYWLSNIHGEKALAWVKDQDAVSNAKLQGDPLYAQIRAQILASLDTKDRIPTGNVDHGDFYNFWQDASHVRGLWRRTSVADYRNADPKWDVLLDVDKYDAEQHKNWVFHGARCAPGMKRCLVDLSPGGGDAGEIFEFNSAARTFPADGFHLSVAKSNAQYIDADTIVFDTDFGPGTMTKSSYPRIVKIWHRGTPLSDAKQVFEANEADIRAGARVFRGPYGTVTTIERGLTTFTSEHYVLMPDDSTEKLPLPVGAVLHGVVQGRMIFTLRDDWKDGATTYKQGSLLAFDILSFIKTKTMPKIRSSTCPMRTARWNRWRQDRTRSTPPSSRTSPARSIPSSPWRTECGKTRGCRSPKAERQRR